MVSNVKSLFKMLTKLLPPIYMLSRYYLRLRPPIPPIMPAMGILLNIFII